METPPTFGCSIPGAFFPYIGGGGGGDVTWRGGERMSGDAGGKSITPTHHVYEVDVSVVAMGLPLFALH